MVLTFLDYEIIAGITNNFADYKKIARITNYFGVEFLKISFYLNLFVKMEFFRQKERIQVIKYRGGSRGGPRGPGPPPLITKNEAPAPKFYKIEAPEWQF